MYFNLMWCADRDLWCSNGATALNTEKKKTMLTHISCTVPAHCYIFAFTVMEMYGEHFMLTK